MRIPLICKNLGKIFREETTMSMAEQHPIDAHRKARRTKKLDVLVHKTSHGEDALGDMRISRSKHRHKSKERETVSEHHDDVRVHKKQLLQDNERLKKENELLLIRCSDTEVALNKKISRLKEKFLQLQSFNNDVVLENNTIKEQYQELVHNVEEYKRSVENRICPVCEELKGALEKNNLDFALLKNTNKEINEDVKMLKNVVYRLNAQLGRYQEKLYEHNLKVSAPNSALISVKGNIPSDNVLEMSESRSKENVTSASNTNNNPLFHSNISLNLEHHTNHTHSPVSWGKVNVHTLGPLLDAYQESISEKEILIKTYEEEMSNFSVKFKDIVKENENLYEKLTEDDKCSSKLIVQLENVKSELKTCKEQNDLLIKKCAIKQDKLEEVLRFYEQRVETMSRDYKILHEEYYKAKSDVAAMQEKNKMFSAQRDEFLKEKQKFIPLEVHNTSVDECRKLYEELKQHYENEKTKLKEQVQKLNEEIADLKSQIKTVNCDKENLQTNVKSLEAKVKKSESKYVELQQTCSEIQVSRMACRKQLHKAMTFAKELVTEQEKLLQQLNQRQWENKQVKQLGTNIANRMDMLKSQLKIVQRDAYEGLTTVEQTLQEKETLITAMKQQHEDEIKKLQDIIKHKNDNILLKDPSIPVPYYLLYKDKNG